MEKRTINGSHSFLMSRYYLVCMFLVLSSSLSASLIEVAEQRFSLEDQRLALDQAYNGSLDRFPYEINKVQGSDLLLELLSWLVQTHLITHDQDQKEMIEAKVDWLLDCIPQEVLSVSVKREWARLCVGCQVKRFVDYAKSIGVKMPQATPQSASMLPKFIHRFNPTNQPRNQPKPRKKRLPPQNEALKTNNIGRFKRLLTHGKVVLPVLLARLIRGYKAQNTDKALLKSKIDACIGKMNATVEPSSLSKKAVRFFIKQGEKADIAWPQGFTDYVGRLRALPQDPPPAPSPQPADKQNLVPQKGLSWQQIAVPVIIIGAVWGFMWWLKKSKQSKEVIQETQDEFDRPIIAVK